MQFEKIRRINKNKIIVGGLISLGVISAISILPSFAKYRLTDSINIANGTVNYKVPDLKVIAMYTSEDGINYNETTIMPESGYVINEEKTYCTTDNVNQVKGKIKTENGKVTLQSLTKGDKCYLYFDKEKSAAEKTLAKLNITNVKDITLDFSQAATTDEGVYKVSDGMYGGTSYYWRGAVTNNYVKFANFCWRIVRINGDGSIRLIYDGTTCHANGTSTIESIAVGGQTYSKDGVYDRSEYVGYTYVVGRQRGLTDASNLKTQLESWYKTNITDKGYNTIVSTGKFCNDRTTASGYGWSSQPSSSFHYAARGRLDSAKTPMLSCINTSDVYSLEVGTITADEVAFAGGVVGTGNSKYYLYNGQYYWTMSPFTWDYITSSYRYAHVSCVNNNGQLSAPTVHNTDPGIRPVINLKADVTFSSGNGQKDTPFVVD